MEEAGEGNTAAGGIKKGRGGGSCSCCMINDVVGEELLTEILIRLPLDQIFRCKSVCKQWLSLIQNPLFAANYSKKKKTQQSGKLKLKLSCILHPHPQQNSPVLIPTNERHHNDDGARKRLEFSLDFVPDFPQLHGADNYNHIVRRAAADKKNFVKEKNLYALCAQQAMISVLPDDGSKKGQIQAILSAVDRRRPQRYYSNRDFILGSSNGLLLCAPLLYTPISTNSLMDLVFDDFPATYVVCNPYTKQWLQVPPPPSLPPSSISRHAANVGFVSDFDSMDRGGGCWFRIVRFPLDSEPPPPRSFKLQVFSSHTWEWTTVTMPSLPRSRSTEAATLPSLPWPIWAKYSVQIVVAVTLKKKNGGPRLCWMVNRTRAIVYDPIKNVVDVVIGVMQPPDRSIGHRVVVFDAMCVSRGCLWAGSLRSQRKLKIYRASGKKWKMVEEYDIQQVYERKALISCRFMTMNPDDPQQVYLRSYKSVVLLNLRTKISKVVGTVEKVTNGVIKGLTVVCDNPLWPTPLPSPFSSPAS